MLYPISFILIARRWCARVDLQGGMDARSARWRVVVGPRCRLVTALLRHHPHAPTTRREVLNQ
eukprot:1178424-Prorocentrum_minimum.AAC.1